MGNPLVRFCEGQGNNYDQDKILWHRRASGRQTEKTNVVLSSWESPVYSRATWQWLPVEEEIGKS